MEITNKYGIKFLIEKSKDFDDSGRMIDGNGYFASIVKDSHIMSGVFFDSYDQALNACHSYKG